MFCGILDVLVGVIAGMAPVPDTMAPTMLGFAVRVHVVVVLG